MDHIKLCDKIYLVGRGDWGHLPRLTSKYDCNIYLIDGGSELALIDNGEALNFLKLRKNIISTGLSVKKIKKLLITHNHFDHVANTWILKKIFKAAVFAGKGSYFTLKPDRFVKTGDRINVGNVQLRVFNTPGHTPDGICFLTEINGKKVLFTGDTALGDQPRSGKGLVGWYNALWGSDLKKYIKSVRFIKNMDADIILPGHGAPHLTKKRCRVSMRNCLKRIVRFGRYKELESMIPLAFDREGVEKCFNLSPDTQLKFNIRLVKKRGK